MTEEHFRIKPKIGKHVAWEFQEMRQTLKEDAEWKNDDKQWNILWRSFEKSIWYMSKGLKRIYSEKDQPSSIPNWK